MLYRDRTTGETEAYSNLRGEKKMNLLDFQLQLSISPDRIWEVLGALNCI